MKQAGGRTTSGLHRRALEAAPRYACELTTGMGAQRTPEYSIGSRSPAKRRGMFTSADRSIGLVLSGGGARGAYEAGVLLHVAEKRPELLERIRVVTGTSVGAVNAAFLASHGLTVDSVRALAGLWRGLQVDSLLQIDQRGMTRMISAGGRRVLGRPTSSPVIGVFDVAGISRLVTEEIDWHGLRSVVRSGRLSAVGIAATDVGTGRTHFFVDHSDAIEPRWPRGEDAPVPIRVHLGPAHVLASAAIPLLFPPIQIGDRWYVDGGIRYNTPLAPALGLGADALFIVSVRGSTDVPEPPAGEQFPGIGQVVGKLLDSVFLDRVVYDLDRLARINDMVSAIETLGPDALARVREELRRVGRPSYRYVPSVHVRPQSDLGALASSHLQRASLGAGRLSLARVLAALFQDDRGTSGDAASFLFFDGGYAEALIEAGRRDAEAAL